MPIDIEKRVFSTKISRNYTTNYELSELIYTTIIFIKEKGIDTTKIVYSLKVA